MNGVGKNKLRRFRLRLRLIILLWIIPSLASVIGCTRVSEEPAWFQSSVSGKTLSSGELISMIKAVDSISHLDAMKSEYESRGGRSGEVMGAMDRRREELGE